MVLGLIYDLTDQYKQFIGINKDDITTTASLIDQRDAFIYRDLGGWASLQTFQEHWDFDAADFRAMYERSFANTLGNPLWEDHNYYPKKAMLALIDYDANLVHSMFKELFNESLDIEGRIDRFVYHCDQLSTDIMRTNANYQNHYHGDYRMISVYLTFMFPTRYTIYVHDQYRLFMKLIKAKPEITHPDIGRFFKAMRTIYAIISKDEELILLHRELRFGRKELYQHESLMLMHDFYFYCSKLKL